MFGLFKKSVQFWGLVRLLAWGESDKAGVMGEWCQIIRHLGSGMFDLIPLGSLVRMRKPRWSARCLGIENKGPFRFNFFTDKPSRNPSRQSVSCPHGRGRFRGDRANCL